MSEKYPAETVPEDEDDGTMPENVELLREAVVGRRIVSVETGVAHADMWGVSNTLITLDDGRVVCLENSADCCAFTALEAFLLHPDKVEHAITGVGTTDGYTTWHIFADMGDILELTVGWSCGNPFFYSYGFHIEVADPATRSEHE